LKKYRGMAESVKNPWFLTFTLKRQPITTKALDLVRDSFKKLYKAHCWSGLYQVELGTVKDGDDGQPTANIHLHALVEDYDLFSPGQSWSELVSCWHQMTGAVVIDIERIWRKEKAIDYLTKHLLKRPYKGDISEWTRKVINAELRGKRMVHQFGRFYRMKGDSDDKKTPIVCSKCGTTMIEQVLTYNSPENIKKYYEKLENDLNPR